MNGTLTWQHKNTALTRSWFQITRRTVRINLSGMWHFPVPPLRFR